MDQYECTFSCLELSSYRATEGAASIGPDLPGQGVDGARQTELVVTGMYHKNGVPHGNISFAIWRHVVTTTQLADMRCLLA